MKKFLKKHLGLVSLVLLLIGVLVFSSLINAMATDGLFDTGQSTVLSDGGGLQDDGGLSEDAYLDEGGEGPFMMVMSGPAALNTITINAVAGKRYDIGIAASDITSFSGMTVTMQYDPARMQLIDLCAFTKAKELSAGAIPGVGVTVSQISSGAIVFTVSKGIPSGSMWSGAINTISFKALQSGNTIVTVTENNTKVATPTASPTTGTYSTTQNVALSCTTAGATIRYTTNGSEPTSSSTQYSTPIQVAVTTTIKAKAFKPGLTDSDTAIFTYTIKVATPTASPTPDTYSSTQNVALSCTTAGATIRYTTNGSEPTSSSTQYSSPIQVAATTTIKAKAFMTGLADSDTASFTYTIQPKVATPTTSPTPGTYSSTQNVTLSCTTVGATIRYTTNGSEPTSSSTQYSTPIQVAATTTIKTKAFMTGLTDSDTAIFEYTIQAKVATPTASPTPDTYSSTQNVTLSCTTAGATIRYTTNGSEPTSSSTQYSSPITVAATTTIKAKAFKSGLTDSDTASFTYTISPSGGLYTLHFDQIEYIFDTCVSSEIYITAYVKDSQGSTVPASIVYTTDRGEENTTGVFEQLDFGRFGTTESGVTATATLSSGAVLQEWARVEIIF